jgi:ribosome biogenesis GTPase
MTLDMIDSDTFSRLRRWGLKPLQLQAAAAPMAAEPQAQLLRVTQVQREGLVVHDGLGERPARLLPALRHTLEAQADAIACGDWVLARDDGHGTWWAFERRSRSWRAACTTGATRWSAWSSSATSTRRCW